MCLIPLIALLLWGVISPRSQWKTLYAWRYRNPDANEPSDTLYELNRLGNIVGVGLLVWMAISAIHPFRDDDARPTATATTRAPQATTSLDVDLLVAFGVNKATVVTPPVVKKQPSSAQPVKVLRRQEVDAGRPPAYVAQALTGKSGAWLILGMHAGAPPTSVLVNEVSKGFVAVSVFTDCATDCPAATAGSANDDYYLVPVQLTKPLGGRLVVGADNQPVP